MAIALLVVGVASTVAASAPPASPIRDAYRAFVDRLPVTQPAYAAQRVPAFLEGFDWVLSEPAPPGVRFQSRRRRPDPATVFAVPSALPALLQEVARSLDRGRRAHRVVVFAADDLPLSAALGPNHTARAASVALLRHYFARIFYEGTDMRVEGISTMPIGLSEFYLARGVWRNASEAMERASLERKPHVALAAWNAYWSLDNPSRLQAGHFARSLPARQAGVEVALLDRRAWWGELSKYKFLLIPMGSRIQCVKMIESLLVLTIPIIQRGRYKWGADRGGHTTLYFSRSARHADGAYAAPDDLLAMGFPIVVVDYWREISAANLSRWWDELSPRLISFRQNCLTSEGLWS